MPLEREEVVLGHGSTTESPVAIAAAAFSSCDAVTADESFVVQNAALAMAANIVADARKARVVDARGDTRDMFSSSEWSAGASGRDAYRKRSNQSRRVFGTRR
jgi:hypothetical protein